MSPPRPIKRTKITDTRSSNSGISPDAVASSSRVVESTPSVATATVDIKSILLSLYDTKTQAQAIKIMESLKILLKGSKANCQELFDLEGTSAILSAIHRFRKSAKVVNDALGRLITITYHLREASNLLIRLDFHETLLSLANMHSDSIIVQHKAAILFQNMAAASNPQSKNKLGTEEIIQFMRNSMTTFPDNIKLVKGACSYFDDMSNIPELKDRLLENEVAQPLVTAFQKFRKWKDDDIDGNEDIKQLVEVLVRFGKRAVVNLLS